MSAPIGKGDWVECLIDADFGFRKGKLFQVSLVGPVTGCAACDTRSHAGFQFYGVENRPGHFWAGCRFRPIYRRKQELIDSLKAPPKEAPIQQPETVGGSAGFGPRVAARLVPGET